MEAAALPVRRSKRLISRRTTAAPQIDAAPAGIETAAAGSASASRRARRKRRTAQIAIPYRRAKTLRQPHLARPVSNPNPDHQNRDLVVASNKLQPPPPSPDYHRAVDPPPCPNWWRRDWSDLGDGPAGLIAERVLAYDVADYVRFRAVCRPWRLSSTEPRSHSGLDRRFHPWRWTMLREELEAPNRRCFLSTYTAECVKVDIPELRDHELLALTPEGLLVLVHKKQRFTVRLLNPLTRHLIELPPLTTLLPSKDHYMILDHDPDFSTCMAAWGSGIAYGGSAVVLCFNRLSMLGIAKPGDDHWTLLNYEDRRMTMAPLMFAGRFYCVDPTDAVMVLEISPDQPPRLEVAAKLNMAVSSFAHSVHLVNNFGELILVHRRGAPLTARNKSGWRYDAYRVDLDTGKLFPVKSLGGSAVFMGMRCSLSVSPEVFPSGSISADTIYLSFDVSERWQQKVGAYHLPDGRIERACRNWRGLVPRPHTLIDCLS